MWTVTTLGAGLRISLSLSLVLRDGGSSAGGWASQLFIHFVPKHQTPESFHTSLGVFFLQHTVTR